MKKKLVIVPIIIFSFVITLAVVWRLMPKPMFHGDYPYYPDVASITETADVIVVGDVLTAKEVKYLMVDRTPDREDKEKTPYTISTVRVTEVIKGEVKAGDVLTIKQLGDYANKPESTLYEMDGYLKEHNSELMFLCEYSESPYSPVNPAQGLIEVKDDGTLYSTSQYSLFGYKETGTKTVMADTLESAIATIKFYVE